MSTKKLYFPTRLFQPGREIDNVTRVSKHSSNIIVLKAREALKPIEYKTLMDTFLGPVVEFVECNDIAFSSHIVHHLLKRRILTNNDELWFLFADQPM